MIRSADTLQMRCQFRSLPCEPLDRTRQVASGALKTTAKARAISLLFYRSAAGALFRSKEMNDVATRH
jgi:hypothetical protein